MDRSLLELHAKIEEEHWWFTGRRAILHRVISSYLPAGGRLIEVGCGTGGNLPMLCRHGEVVGVDLSPYAVEHAMEAHGVPVMLGSLPDDLPHGLGAFDAVCLFDILEHVEEDRAALSATRSLLKPGGLVFITVPALPWLWSKHDEEFGHHRRYVRAELVDLVEKAGFSLLHCTYFCALLFPPVALLRLAGRLLPSLPASDFRRPTAHLNKVLHTIFSSEGEWVVKRGFPVGSSLLAVAKQ